MEAFLNSMQRADPNVKWFTVSHAASEIVRLRQRFFAVPEPAVPDSHYAYTKQRGDRLKHQRYTTTFLTLLEHCETTFCLHIDSDMLLFGGPKDTSWTQYAMETMLSSPWMLNIAPEPCPETSNQLAVRGEPRFFSTQAMLIHKERLLDFSRRHTVFDGTKAIEQMVDNSLYQEHDALQQEYMAKGYVAHRETIVNPLKENEPKYERLTAVYRTGVVTTAWTVHPPIDKAGRATFDADVPSFIARIENGQFLTGSEDCDIMDRPTEWLLLRTATPSTQRRDG